MRSILRQVVFALLAACITAPLALAAKPDIAAQTAAEIRAADIAFAQAAATVGAARAFAQTMDPQDGLQYGGAKPVRGAAAIFAALGGDAPEKTHLAWVPTGAFGSRGGDMGVTLGDYTLTKIGQTVPIETGRYVTVWRRDAKGVWKGLVDIGETDAKPIENAVARATQPPKSAP